MRCRKWVKTALHATRIASLTFSRGSSACSRLCNVESTEELASEAMTGLPGAQLTLDTRSAVSCRLDVTRQGTKKGVARSRFCNLERARVKRERRVKRLQGKQGGGMEMDRLSAAFSKGRRSILSLFLAVRCKVTLFPGLLQSARATNKREMEDSR